MPTSDIHTKREAIKEFNMSLFKANADDYLRVHVSEKDKDGVWRDTSGCDTVRFFKQDERSIASIDKTTLVQTQKNGSESYQLRSRTFQTNYGV